MQYFRLYLYSLLLFCPLLLHSAVYFVDNVYGKDSYSGLSPEKAWQSLEQVNAQIFVPGDLILFKSGGFWRGQLAPKGSGDAQKPIRISSYGDGLPPLIDGGGIEGTGVLRLYNQSYWEIEGLEITNFATVPGDRRGIEIKAANSGLIQHIHLKNLIIHDIKGIVGNSLTAKKTAGIYIAVTDDSEKSTRFHNILISNCEIYNIQNQGIVTNNEVTHADYPGTDAWHRRKFTGLIIRNNIVHHISKNAMIVRLAEGGLVEHNLCYETALGITGNTIFSRSSRNTVFQYNEGFSNRSIDYDGSLYDPDYSSPGTIWQYSYSHDNAHGLLWVCTTDTDRDIEVRYNLSVNDRGILFYLNYPVSGIRIHHNNIIIPSYLHPTLLKERTDYAHTYSFENNTIINTSQNTNVLLDISQQKQQSRQIGQNTLFGNLPNDPTGLLNDFSLVLPADIRTESSYASTYSFAEGTTETTTENTTILGTVNGIPIEKIELLEELKLQRATWFANTDGDYAKLEAIVLEQLIRKKLEEQDLIHQGIVPPRWIQSTQIEAEHSSNNQKRSALQETGGVVYGPTRFTRHQWAQYRHLNYMIKLKDKLAEKEFDLSAPLLSAYFEQNQHLFNSRKQFADYRGNEASVKLHYLEEQYEQRLNEKLAAAEINLNKATISQLIRQTKLINQE